MRNPSNYNWKQFFMREVYRWAEKSKDPSSKIGALLVHWEEKDVFSHGYNGPVRGVNDDILERWERPEKYYWCEHGERNSLYNCAQNGRATKGSWMFTQATPCMDCGRGIVQAGISKVVLHKQWEDNAVINEKWAESQKRTHEMFYECRVEVEYFDGILGEKGMWNGEIINV